LLGDIQSAFSAEDLPALRGALTPEMLSYFSEQLADNASRGLVNRVTDVILLQGDLSEAWRVVCTTKAQSGSSPPSIDAYETIANTPEAIANIGISVKEVY
jgi:predicted lipid-binding transport protein (Tim44 family)